MEKQKYITTRSARVVPILLLIASIYMGVTDSPWWFLSIPFIAIGWFSAVPNLNLIDGMFAYLSMIAGFILLHFHQPSGAAIALGTMTAFYLCAFEMRVTGKPYEPEQDETAEQSHPEATSKPAAFQAPGSEASDA